MAEKQRSPNYPGFGLTEAILKAKQLYEHDGKATVPREVAVQAWGYRGLNGASLRALGALRQFGLLDMPTAGSVKLSADALVLILEPDGSLDRKAALSSVAMRPSIFRQLQSTYPDGLPSDAAVVSHLVRTANFSEDSARAVIASYRDTLGLAGSAIVANTPQNNGGTKDDDDGGAAEPRQNPGNKPKKEQNMPATLQDVGEPYDLQIALIGGALATLRVPRPMSEENFMLLTSLLTANLTAMKPALVLPKPPAPTEDV